MLSVLRRAFAFRAAVFMVACSIHLSVTVHSASPTYRPVLGQTYEYGIEYRVTSNDRESNADFPSRNRTRLRLTVTAVDRDRWTADYESIPSINGRALTDQAASDQYLDSLRKRAEFNPFANQPSIDPMIDRLRMQGQEMMKSMHRLEIANMEAYPGLFQYCHGTVNVNSLGEANEISGNGSMPFLAGHVVNTILVRLPTADQSTSKSFSYKDVISFTRRFGDRDPITTEASILNSLTPRAAASPAQVAFNRDVEMAGGATGGFQLTRSGTGFWEFSETLGMPSTGDIEFKTDGFSFGGRARPLNLRIGFLLLVDWRLDFYNANLTPTADALDPSNLPRLSPKQQNALKQYWSSDSMKQNTDLESMAMRSAPPESGSTFELMTQTARQHLREAAAKPGDQEPTSSDSKRIANGLDRTMARWTHLRELATKLPRTWSDASGSFSVDATLAGRQGDDVILRRVDNSQTLAVPLSRLSPNDVEFAKTFSRLATP